MEKKQIYPYTI